MNRSALPVVVAMALSVGIWFSPPAEADTLASGVYNFFTYDTPYGQVCGHQEAYLAHPGQNGTYKTTATLNTALWSFGGLTCSSGSRFYLAQGDTMCSEIEVRRNGVLDTMNSACAPAGAHNQSTTISNAGTSGGNYQAMGYSYVLLAGGAKTQFAHVYTDYHSL